MNYSNRLKAARRHAKLNQVALAVKSGVSQQTISKIERGLQDASAFTVQFATACEVRPEWLATGAGAMVETPQTAESPAVRYDVPLSPGALEIAKAWTKLSPLKQDLYRETIFRDAATETLLPWLKFGRPDKVSYDLFEKDVEQNYRQHIDQLKLDL